MKKKPASKKQDKPERTYMLGEPNTEQFTVTTFLNDRQVSQQKIHDPFGRTTLIIGWLDLLKSLFQGRAKVQFGLHGSEGAQRAIMTLNPYELEKSTNEILDERRKARAAREAEYLRLSTNVSL